MFLKYTIITALLAGIFAIYLHEFHLSTFNELSSKVTTCQDTLLQWVNNLSGGNKDSAKDGKNMNLKKVKLYTVDELKKYDGADGSLGLYLSVMGQVYDVGAGKKHYGPGGSYHFFTGRDGSRAFVTGEFTEEGLTDDVMGLSPKEVKGIAQWQDFYKKDYKYKGNLIGRYYDSNGKKTAYSMEVDRLIEEATREEENEKNEKKLFPPCNSEWSQETGSRVWCTTMSGGIERDWAGVPRQFYEPGSTTYRCACIKMSATDLNMAQIKQYPECNPDAASCQVLT